MLFLTWASLGLSFVVFLAALCRAAKAPAAPAAARVHPHRPQESDPIEGYVPELPGSDPAFGPAPLPVRRRKPWIPAARASAGRSYIIGADDEDILLHLLGRVAGPGVDVG